MSDRGKLLSQFYFTIDGAESPAQLVGDLLEVTVESSLHLPDVATLTFHDPRLRWIDEELLAPGKALVIAAKAGGGERPLFDGELVEIEPEFGAETHNLVVRAFDRLHRLTRGYHVRSFQNVTDREIVEKLAREVGLEAKVGPTPRRHPYVLQANQTNLAFLQERAAALGYLLFVEGKTLHCEAPEPAESPVELRWGEGLSEFRPRLSTIGQVSVAVARGWDPSTRQEIMREAERGRGAPAIQDDRPGAKVAEDAFHITAQRLVIDRPIRTQEEAAQLAQAAADQSAQRFVEAEGLCGGSPAIIAGTAVKIGAVGNRFGGTYYVTSAIHVYNADEGYSTEFKVSGLHPATLLSVLAPGSEPRLANGLAVAIVTDNNDPDGLCRVKVKFPWLSTEHTSDWVRVAAPGAGAERGALFLPEIDDEVLIGFELGDIHYPVILGGLWNGVDLPPMGSGELLEGSKVRRRIIRSRAGHEIVIDDGDDGGLTIDIKGDVTLKGSGKMRIEADGELIMKGSKIQLNP